MYGLKQTAIIAYNQLIYNMDPHGYHPVLFKTGLWDHRTRRTKICLCVDDFEAIYFKEYDADHLLESL